MASVDHEFNIRIRTPHPVFKLRTHLGLMLMRVALWIMGAEAESSL